mgnify:CR=1 FL=1
MGPLQGLRVVELASIGPGPGPALNNAEWTSGGDAIQIGADKAAFSPHACGEQEIGRAVSLWASPLF